MKMILDVEVTELAINFVKWIIIDSNKRYYKSGNKYLIQLFQPQLQFSIFADVKDIADCLFEERN